jgi:hypothetical protein
MKSIVFLLYLRPGDSATVCSNWPRSTLRISFLLSGDIANCRRGVVLPVEEIIEVFSLEVREVILTKII